MRSRAGVTLVEVMLAGAICSLLTLSLLEGVIVATKLAHENAELLSADALAWDTAWKWLNKAYDEMPSETYDSSAKNSRLVLTDADCPPLAAARTGAAPRLVVSVTSVSDFSRHGTSVSAKRIDVNVEWGPTGARKALNDLGRADGTASYSHPVTVYKCSVDRGTSE